MTRPDPKRLADRFLTASTEESGEVRTASRNKTAGEVRFIKDRSGDKSEWAWGSPGPSEREMSAQFQFKPHQLKPLARALRSTHMALGHAMSASQTFTKIKSAKVSPDGSLGGKGYIQKIPDMRRQFANCVEVLSALSDTIYDEIKAPHWNPAIEEDLSGRDREEVEELLDDSEQIREDPKGWAGKEETEMDTEHKHSEGDVHDGKAARTKVASSRAAADDRKWWVTKRGDQPYSGPAWKNDTPRWFDSKREAEAMAKTLGERNPVGFSVKQIPKGWTAGKYPRMQKVKAAGAPTIDDIYFRRDR